MLGERLGIAALSVLEHLEIIDLKRFAGALPRIFVVGCNLSENAEELKSRLTEWNVPRTAQVGDLILMYRGYNAHEIRDAWEIVGPFNDYEKDNKEGNWPGLQAGLRRVVKFNHPVSYDALKNDPITQNLGVVRARFRGKHDITDDWPLIRDKIIGLNPTAKKTLAKYRFDEQ